MNSSTSTLRGSWVVSLLAGAICVILSLFMTKAIAQEFRDLASMSEYAESYPFVRCGALYQALMEWSGQERLGANLWQQFDQARTDLLLHATLQYFDDGIGGSLEGATDAVVRDVMSISSIYLVRFEQNFAVVGSAFAEDEIVNSDLRSCQSTYETVFSTLEQQE